MNVSLRRRLFLWLSACILIAGCVAAAVSFALSYEDANDLQDAQLEQVASVVSRESLSASASDFRPRNTEDAETHFVIRLLGSPSINPNPNIDVSLPDSLPSGVQTLDQQGVKWRVLVSASTAGQRFAIAQRTTIRDEVARDSALLTLLPLLALVPVLLLIVGVVLRQAFTPMIAMTADLDRLDGNQLTPLNEQHVPLESLPLVQAVNRLMRRLAMALEQQRRLISDAAHELRTPVAILIVQADNVQNVQLPPEASARMGALRQGLARMSSLIDQLLDLARIQGAGRSSSQRLELGSIVRSAIEETLPLAQGKGIDLGCVKFDDVSIHGDSLHAYALVRNAIDNAVRYTPAGGRVDVSVTVERGLATLVVEDTGPGIAPQDMDRVFEPFVRILGSQQPGSGLGLAIARTAARSLGGRIDLALRDDGHSGLRFVYQQRTS